MDQREFSKYCKSGKVAKVKEGLLDKSINPSYARNHDIKWASANGPY
jgi:hypothetical protein